MTDEQDRREEANEEHEEEEEQQQYQQGAAAEELPRRGPWTADEDLTLVNYITGHGAGRWTELPRAAGLKRTWKSCRLRWINYLQPDLKRRDFTADEQLLILDLHSRWGHRWSRIAAHLPGRTENEIKNCWQTLMQKRIKQLNCDVNSSTKQQLKAAAEREALRVHRQHQLRIVDRHPGRGNRLPAVSPSPTTPMSSLPPPRLIDREEDDGCQRSQPAKRLRCSSCNDDQQMELFEELRNMFEKQNQKFESVFQENRHLREKVSRLTEDVSRLHGLLQQSSTPRLLSDQHCSTPLRLRFLNSCKNDKYSKQKLEADDKTPLKVAIYSHKNEIITSEPFSSMRVHIVPIEGDFDNDHKGQWTEEYFRSKIVSGRPGKEPLLFGDLYIRLQDGVGYLNTAKFQDNSSFVASKRFRLAVVAADIRISERVQEGITESFAVKDIRGYSTKKNLYPSPQDPVYKLRKIAKDGDRHKMLEKKGIKTVGDFVLSYNKSHEDLRKILGRISDQDWDVIIDHAQKCNPRPGNQEYQVISRSDGSHYFKGSSSMEPTNPALQKLDYQGMHQQSSSTYTELSCGVSLEDVPRDQVGLQVDEDQISGVGNEVLSASVPLIDGSNSEQVHYGYFTTDDVPLAVVSEDSGWGGYFSAFEQPGGCTPASEAATPASEAGSCASLMHCPRSPVLGTQGQACPTLSSSSAGGASSSSYWINPAQADNINNASAQYMDTEEFLSSIMADPSESGTLWM